MHPVDLVLSITSLKHNQRASLSCTETDHCPAPGAKARSFDSSLIGNHERLTIADDQTVFGGQRTHDLAQRDRYYGRDLVLLPPSGSVTLFVRMEFPCGTISTPFHP
jgi:hypothetical protein